MAGSEGRTSHDKMHSLGLTISSVDAYRRKEYELSRNGHKLGLADRLKGRVAALFSLFCSTCQQIWINDSLELVFSIKWTKQLNGGEFNRV